MDATLVVNVFDDAPKQMDFRYESPGLVTPEEGPFAGLPGVEGKALIDYGADGKGNESPATGEIPAFRIGAVFDGEYVQSEGETDDNGYIRVPGELGALYINPETGEYFYHVHSPIGPDDHWKDIFSYTLTDADGS